MKRTILAAVLVLLTGAAVALAYQAASRDREYRRLVAAGDAAFAGGQTGAAIEAFSGAIALREESMLAWLRRGETYLAHGDPLAALRDLRQATVLDPTATRPREQLGDVNARLGRYDRAAEEYAEYVALDDRSPRVLYKQALAMFRGGHPETAAETVRRALALSDRMPEAHYLLGLCLRATGRRAEARAALERALALAPALTAAREELAALHAEMGRPRDRIEQLEALAALEPRRPDRQVALALAHATAGRPDLAVLTLGRAAERDPNHVNTFRALGEVWLRVAETRDDQVALQKALEALRSVVMRDASSRTLAVYGRALLAAGNHAAAADALREAVARLPVEPDAFLHLATAEQRLHRPAAARDALARYLAILPAEAPPVASVHRAADLSLRLDEPEVAIRLLAPIAAGAAADADTLARLAEAQHRAGRDEAARETVAAGLARDPAHERLRRLERALR